MKRKRCQLRTVGLCLALMGSRILADLTMGGISRSDGLLNARGLLLEHMNAVLGSLMVGVDQLGRKDSLLGLQGSDGGLVSGLRGLQGVQRRLMLLQLGFQGGDRLVQRSKTGSTLLCLRESGLCLLLLGGQHAALSRDGGGQLRQGEVVPAQGCMFLYGGFPLGSISLCDVVGAVGCVFTALGSVSGLLCGFHGGFIHDQRRKLRRMGMLQAAAHRAGKSGVQVFLRQMTRLLREPCSGQLLIPGLGRRGCGDALLPFVQTQLHGALCGQQGVVFLGQCVQVGKGAGCILGGLAMPLCQCGTVRQSSLLGLAGGNISGQRGNLLREGCSFCLTMGHLSFQGADFRQTGLASRIIGQQGFNGCGFREHAGGFWLPGFGFFQGGQGARQAIAVLQHQLLCVGKLPLKLQSLKRLFTLAGQIGVDSIEANQLLLKRCFQVFILRDAGGNQMIRFTGRQFIRLKCGKLICRSGIRCQFDCAERVANDSPMLVTEALLIGGVLGQPLLQAAVIGRGEQIAEQGDPFIRIRLEQLAEFPLGDHRHLLELLPVQPQKADQPTVHAAICNNGAVGQMQFSGRLFFHQSCTALFGAQISRVAADGIFEALVQKREDHIGRSGRISVHAAQHFGGTQRICLTFAAAGGRVVQGIGDGIKNGGLARAGITADEIEPIVAQAGEIQLLHAGVGTKGAQGQLQRSHVLSSQISRIKSST